jgi:hypothetical protein
VGARVCAHVRETMEVGVHASLENFHLRLSKQRQPLFTAFSAARLFSLSTRTPPYSPFSPPSPHFSAPCFPRRPSRVRVAFCVSPSPSSTSFVCAPTTNTAFYFAGGSRFRHFLFALGQRLYFFTKPPPMRAPVISLLASSVCVSPFF